MTSLLARAYLIFVESIDIGGADRRASFSKLVLIAVLVLGTFYKLPVVLGIACIAASFGVKTFLAFLNRGTFNASAHTSVHISKAIAARRTDDGIEETP